MSLLSLRSLRLRPGEERREVVDVAPEPLVLAGERYSISPTPAPVDVVVTEATGATVLSLHGQVKLDGPCMRCLGPATVVLEVEGREVHSGDPGVDPELRSEYVEEDEVDVGAWLRDAVALALPDQLLCRPDCAGLCGVCGKNLNEEPHVHEEVTVDSRWSALEELRDQL
jgi:uncharacterized protein